jgi:hypothetical protein
MRGYHVDTVPGEPRKVKLEAINSTAVGVQWRPPAEREQNGVIRGYQVLYVKLDDEEEGVGETHVHNVDGENCLEVFYSVVKQICFVLLLCKVLLTMVVKSVAGFCCCLN